MYLLSQNKKNLIKFEKLELRKTFGTYSITAYGIGNGTFEQVGEYTTEEQANQEFNHIMMALKQGLIVYEVQ